MTIGGYYASKKLGLETVISFPAAFSVFSLLSKLAFIGITGPK